VYDGPLLRARTELSVTLTDTTSAPGRRFRRTRGPADRARLGIYIVLVAQLMLVLDATVVNVALPRIDADLHFGPASLSWVLNAYTLAFGGLLLLGGRLGDVRGRLRTFEAGLALFVLASLLGGLAPTTELLIGARALQGVGAALAAPSVLALLTTSARDDAERNRALALFTAVSSGGASIGLLLGGLLTDFASWRWAMFINVPIGLAVLALAPMYVRETQRRPGRFDVVGAVTATLGAVAIVWSLIGTPEHGWTSARTVIGLAVGVVSLATLAFNERRVAHPMIQPALLANRTRVAALAMMALVVGAQLSMFFLVVQYVQNVLGFGPLASGFAFLPFSLGIFTMSRFTPRLVMRFGPLPLVMTGATALTFGYIWLSGAGLESSYLGAVFGPMLIGGLAGALCFMPITATVLNGVEPEHAGGASGMLQTTQQLGSAVGVAVIVSVYAAGAVPGEFLPGAQAAFLTSALFSGLAATIAALVWLLGRRPAAVPESDSVEEIVLADAA
jgi:EmrB/QacA subfamily drug resistance transporter